MKVSVIMSVCHRKYDPVQIRYLQIAVASILTQTFSEFEFLIYSDGSCRETEMLLQNYAEQDPRIRYIRSGQNRGLAYGLNRCLEMACGELIARMDDDDLSLPRRLEKQVDFLKTHPEYAFVGCSALLMDDEQIWGERKMEVSPDRYSFLKFSPYIHPSVMFRRNVLKSCGGYDISSKVLRCEDYELFLRLHKMGLHGHNLPEKLLIYRESRSGLAKRRFRFRINESRLRWNYFPSMHLTQSQILYYTIRPLLIGFIPSKIAWKLRRILIH